MPWKPQHPGDFPTLGWAVLDWMSENLAAPDRASYEPFTPTLEQAEFCLNFYRLDPHTGRRAIRRAVLSRPRGWGKSPWLAALACAEALADVVPDGWDAEGQPVGKPWSAVRTPLVQVAAVSEQQTANTWTPLLEMLRGGPVIDNYPGTDPLDSFVNLPAGRIAPITASPQSVKGNRSVFSVLDQTEEWVRSNSGLRMAETMRINAAKIGGTTIESPNAFTPGVESVAEQSAAYWNAIQQGRAKDAGLLYDHREAPGTTDLDDRDSLLGGLRYAYGDSSDHPDGCVLHNPPCPPGWSPLERIVADIWDPANDPQTSRADFLNQVTHAADSWLSAPEWAACLDLAQEEPPPPLADKDTVVLGFDGSRRRGRGVTDATALIGCRVSDGHLFELRVWEQPTGPAGQDWQAPTAEVDAEVRSAFRRFRVVGFYADPALWETWVAKWEAAYSSQLLVKSTRDHPVEWWMTGGRSTTTARALEQFHTAVVERELTHDGSSALTAHVLNARRRPTRSGLQIAKENPSSARKIDAAVAAVLAWTARQDAVAAGVGQRRTTAIPQRIR